MTIKNKDEFADKNSLAIRNLRKIITSQGKGIIAITSIEANASTAGIAVELAKAIRVQQSGVLLIDCNASDPEVHKWFDIPNTVGLFDGMTSEKPVDQQNMVNVEIGENIFINVIPCEATQDKRETITSTSSLSKILGYKDKFNYVILVLPQLNSSFEAAELMSIANQIYVCFTPLQNTRSEIAKFLQQLEFSKSKINGWIVIDRKFKKYDYFAKFIPNHTKRNG